MCLLVHGFLRSGTGTFLSIFNCHCHYYVLLLKLQSQLHLLPQQLLPLQPVAALGEGRCRTEQHRIQLW